MQAIFFVPKESYEQVKNKMLADDLVSRQSINFRDNTSLGLDKEGYYIEIDGDKEALAKARELVNKSGKELKGKDKNTILKVIKDQEEKSMQGFGSIFG